MYLLWYYAVDIICKITSTMHLIVAIVLFSSILELDGKAISKIYYGANYKVAALLISIISAIIGLHGYLITSFKGRGYGTPEEITIALVLQILTLIAYKYILMYLENKEKQN